MYHDVLLEELSWVLGSIFGLDSYTLTFPDLLRIWQQTQMWLPVGWNERFLSENTTVATCRGIKGDQRLYLFSQVCKQRHRCYSLTLRPTLHGHWSENPDQITLVQSKVSEKAILVIHSPYLVRHIQHVSFPSLPITSRLKKKNGKNPRAIIQHADRTAVKPSPLPLSPVPLYAPIRGVQFSLLSSSFLSFRKDGFRSLDQKKKKSSPWDFLPPPKKWTRFISGE